MTSKKVIPFLVLTAAALLAAMPLFAGGSKESSSTGASSGKITASMTSGPEGYPAYNGPQADITMWAWTSNENYSIDLFQKLYPNITVKWSNLGGGTPCLFIGDGAKLYESALGAAFGNEVRCCAGDGYPSLASAVARLGEERLHVSEGDFLGAMVPVYLRLSEAEMKHRELS